jgi:hypothetical protein
MFKFLLIIHLLSLSFTISLRQADNHVDKKSDFLITIPLTWQFGSTFDDNSYSFKPLNTYSIGDGTITKLDIDPTLTLNDALSRFVENELFTDTYHREKFEEFKMSNGYDAIRYIDGVMIFEMELEGYFVVIRAGDSFYAVAAYYETSIRDDMRQGIDVILGSFILSKKN